MTPTWKRVFYPTEHCQEACGQNEKLGVYRGLPALFLMYLPLGAERHRGGCPCEPLL